MTLLIRNVRILGGEKEFPDPIDVFVNGDTISAIGNFANKKADTILDGQGGYLTPGFIDIDSTSDHYLTLFDDRGQEDFIRQGVTTIIGGMCGASLAPLAYGTLESIQKWGDPSRVNVNWHTMAEFLSVLDARPLAVNFGTLAGHATIRRALVGEALRELTKNEMNVFARMLEEAMKQGAFGLSTGLSYVHARATTDLELNFFTDVVARFGGVYATHLRDGAAGVVRSIEETVSLAKERGVKTLISHFMPMLGAGKEYEAALAEIESLPANMEFRFDAHPFADSLLPIYTFLPEWAQNGGIGVMVANVNDQWLLTRIKKDMSELDEDHFIIAQAPGNEFLVGKTLRELGVTYGTGDARDAVLKLMATTKMKCSVLYRNIDEVLIAKAIGSPRSLVASAAPSWSRSGPAGKKRRFRTERTTSTFTKFLGLAAGGLMPLDMAVRKITTEPAALFGLKGRGVIREGNIADLACFKVDGQAGDPVEVLFTVVNGITVRAGDEFKDVFPGKVLRHNAS